MIEDLNNNSLEFFIIKTLKDKLEQSSNEKLRKKFKNKDRIYLDDDIDVLHDFVAIIDEISEESHKAASSHLKGDLKSIDSDEIREILSEYRITTYGRSGMKLNSKLLSDVE